MRGDGLTQDRLDYAVAFPLFVGQGNLLITNSRDDRS